MGFPSITVLISGVFLAYMGHSMYTIYQLFNPEPCPPNKHCLRAFMETLPTPQYELHIYTSKKERVLAHKDQKLLWKYTNFTVGDPYEETINVTVPISARKNGSLYAHVYLVPEGESPFSNSWTSYGVSKMTTFALPQSETFNLMGEKEDNKEKKPDKNIPISHWRSEMTISVMDSTMPFDRQGIPAEVYRLLRISPENEYLPVLYIDTLSNRIKHLMPLNETVRKLPLKIQYRPISVGKLRMWVNMGEAIKNLHNLGFTEKDTDEIKGIFADTNFHLLMLTFAVAAFHLLFDFLAFKNDISYWRNRETMVGLSTRVVLWRCFSTIIIFLYLKNEETSLLVLIPAGIGAVIEVWKVKKALKISITWAGWRPGLEFGTTSDKERETSSFDSQAMKYLSYVLYPLCLGGAVYSLLYVPHKSWYSWCINSLVNGVYAFGFLFMLPQLFVNYKLKSVAHLPWRAFMYKAFNTFIDDVFAFIITMPTAHRLACFRDDVVFVLYLYQRWLYPVDKTRVNEFGQSFEDENKEAESKKTK